MTVGAARNDLYLMEVDRELTPGAENAIRTCLRLQSDERITIVTDLKTLEIAASLAQQVKNVGSAMNIHVLEDYAPRPVKEMPAPILEDLSRSQVSILAVVPQTGELVSRMQMTDVVNKNRIRHAHMVHISRRIMCEGMRANFHKVDELGTKLVGQVRAARVITATTPAGTNIVAEFSPGLRWVKTSGIISRDTWGNLPGGEIFTCPGNVNGLFVVDGVVGDYLCQKYGDLRKNPLAIEVKNSRIASLSCSNKDLEEEFRAYTKKDENSDRVGEFAIGTNVAVKDIIGEILQDEKLPGIHIAFGHPAGEHTGADWTSTTHIDCVGRRFDIALDGRAIMKNGVFLNDLKPFA